MKQIIDYTRIGTPGFPKYWSELGFAPPLVEVEDDHPEPAYQPDPNAVLYTPPAVSQPPSEVPLDVTAEGVNRERDRRLRRFTFNGKQFDFCDGKGSDINIAGAGTLALGAIIEGKQQGDLRWANPDADFKWVAADNSSMTMDAHTCLNFAKAAAAWKERHIHAARAIKNTTPIPSDYKSDSRWPT